MSARESLAAARTALRMIAKVCSDHPLAPTLAAEALQAIDSAEAAERNKRAADAERKRRNRLGASATVRGPPAPSADVRGRPAPSNAVRVGGEGGGLSTDREREDHLQDPDLLGGGAGGGSPAPSAGQARTVTNATDDGAFGMTVTAWCEGISLVTGQPCPPPAMGAVRQLVTVLNTHRPVDGDAVAWARESAKAYAEANRGRTLSPFGYGDWMASGRPVKAPPSSQNASGGPNGSGNGETPEAARARERERDQAHRQLRKEARPASPETMGQLLGAVGAERGSGVVRKAHPASDPPPASEKAPEVRRELTPEELEAERQRQLREAKKLETGR